MTSPPPRCGPIFFFLSSTALETAQLARSITWQTSTWASPRALSPSSQYQLDGSPRLIAGLVRGTALSFLVSGHACSAPKPVLPWALRALEKSQKRPSGFLGLFLLARVQIHHRGGGYWCFRLVHAGLRRSTITCTCFAPPPLGGS